MAQTDRLAKLQARQAAAAQRETAAAEKRRKVEIALRKEQEAITRARAFAIGNAVLAYLEKHPDAKPRLGPIFEETIKKPAERELLADLMPRSKGDYSELRAASK